VVNIGRKVTPWLCQEVKGAIQGKKVVYKTWLKNRVKFSKHPQFSEARKSAALTVKKSKI